MRRSSVRLAVALLALALAGCGGDDDGPRLADQWAGEVEGTNAYISVFTLDDGQAGAYLADGNGIAALVLGTRDGDKLALPANEDGVAVEASVSGSTVSGVAVVNGREHAFSADSASGEAGWYRARTEVGGDPVAAGYILLADGSQRGAVRRAGEVVATPHFDPAAPEIQLDGIGRLEILPVAEFVDREGGLS